MAWPFPIENTKPLEKLYKQKVACLEPLYKFKSNIAGHTFVNVEFSLDSMVYRYFYIINHEQCNM